MRTYDGVGAAELLVKLTERILLVEKAASGHGYILRQHSERPCDAVVLKAGDEHAAPRLHDGAYRNIERVGSIHGEHHVLRVRDLEQPRRGLAALKHGLRRAHGRSVRSRRPKRS